MQQSYSIKISLLATSSYHWAGGEKTIKQGLMRGGGFDPVPFIFNTI